MYMVMGMSVKSLDFIYIDLHTYLLYVYGSFSGKIMANLQGNHGPIVKSKTVFPRFSHSVPGHVGLQARLWPELSTSLRGTWCGVLAELFLTCLVS